MANLAPININQTTTVQSLADDLKLHTKLQNYFNVGGIASQPMLGIAERVNQVLLARRMGWKFNRVNMGGGNPAINPNFIISQQGFQDYKHAGATCFTLINSTTPGGQLPAGGAGVDLAPGTYQNGTAKVSYGPVNGGTAGVVIDPSTGLITVQFIDPHPFLAGNIGQSLMLMSGLVNPAFNSTFTYNQLAQTSQWTNSYALVSIPDQYHVVLQDNGGQRATITAISATGAVVTVTCANNLAKGDIMSFTGVTTNSALNSVSVTLLSATATTVTFTLPTGVTITNGADTGTIYAANSGAPGIWNLGWVESAAIIDLNNNSFPLPIVPIDAVHRISPEYTTTGDNISLSAEVDYGNGVIGFRLSEPVSTYPFAYSIVYQARAPRFINGQSIFQWPDYLKFVLFELCLWQGMRFAYGITAQETQVQMGVALQALEAALQSEDREDNFQAITPEWNIMR